MLLLLFKQSHLICIRPVVIFITYVQLHPDYVEFELQLSWVNYSGTEMQQLHLVELTGHKHFSGVKVKFLVLLFSFLLHEQFHDHLVPLAIETF